MSLTVIDRGSGPPLVLVPGIQGRWEYMRPAVDALSAFFRVLTFSLCGERTSGAMFESARGLDNFADQIRRVLDDTRLERAAVCGVSFGGVAAVRFAAANPKRTEALILASTPAPVCHLRPRHRLYARLPWVFGPLFLIETPWRLRSEFRATFPDWRARAHFKRSALRTVATAPISFSRMAARARLLASLDLRADCSRIAAPTLVVSGEPHLDYVVPVDGSSEYIRLISGARAAVLQRTGHLGSITRPDVFAAVVRDFVKEHRHAAA